MQKDLKIRISIDKKTGELKVVDSELNQISRSAKKSDASINLFGNSLMSLGAKVGGIYAVKEAFDAVVSTGFQFNKSMEDSIAGLTALTVATSSNISAMGKHLSIAEKYNLAQKEAVKTAKELAKINAQTPHSLEQTNQIYKAMYVSMKNAGASNEQMIELTKKISIAAGAAGVEFNQLLAGVDGLATGTVLANSDMGRFLNGLGLTNKKLKESKDVVGLLTEKLKDFKAVNTMTVAVSNLDNAWQQLTGEITQATFQSTKDELKDLTSWIDKLSTSLHKAMLNVDNALTKSDLEYLLKEKKKELEELNKKAAHSFLSHDYSNAAVKVGEDIAEIEEKLKKLQIAQDKLQAKKSLEKEKALSIEINKLLNTQRTQREKINDTFAKYAKKVKKTYEDEASKEIALKKLREWRNKEVDKLDSVSRKKEDADWIKALQEWYKEDEEEKKKQIALEKEWGDILDANYKSALDYQIELAQSAMDWGDNLTGVAKQIGGISKAIQAFHVAELKGTKAEQETYAKYGKQFIKFQDDREKVMALQKMQDKDIAKIHEETRNAELRGYAQLAGTMAGAYEQGSDAAIAFTAVQSALGIASSWTAIANAWAQPFPANIGAAAMVASQVMPLIQQLGGSGSSGGGATPTVSREESYKAKAEDYAESVKPITDRLDRQIELLQAISGYGGTAVAKELNKAGTEYSHQSHADTITALGLMGRGQSTSIPIGLRYTQVLQDFVQNGLVYDYAGIIKNLEISYGKYVNTQYTNDKNNNVHSDYSIGDYYGKLNLKDSVKNDTGKFVEFLIKAKNNSDLNSFGISNQEYRDIIDQAEKTSHDFAMSIIDSYQTIIDAGKDFKDDYDSIFGDFYKNKALKKAYTDVNQLRGTQSLDAYLKDTIAAIDKMNLTTEQIALLNSEDEKDLADKIELEEQLSKAYGVNIEQALNYKDSIDLVAEAMASSKSNIKSWQDSFKTQDELLQDMAKSFNVKVATTTDELNKLFENLKGGIGGLTDAELEFLNTNKSVVKSLTELSKNEVEYRESILESTQRITDIMQKAMYDAMKATSDYANSLQSITNASLSLKDTLEINNVSSRDAQFYYLTKANRAANDTEALLNKSASSKEIKSSYDALIKYASEIYKLNPSYSKQLNDRIDSINSAIQNTVDILKVQVVDSASSNIEFLTAKQLKSIGLAKEDTLKHLAINGVEAKVLVDNDNIIQSIISKGFTITVGQDWENLSTTLEKGFNWNLPDDFNTIIDGLNNKFDWNKDGLVDAVKSVMPDGGTKLAFDWNNDGTVDLSAILSSDGTLTKIEANTAPATDNITSSNYLKLLYQQALDANNRNLKNLSSSSSSSSFSVGHTLGTKESIDLATILKTNDYGDFYKKIKAFSVKNGDEDIAYLKEMLKNNKYKQYFSDLAKAGVLPDDILKANKTIKDDYFSKLSQLQSKLKSLSDILGKENSYLNQLENTKKSITNDLQSPYKWRQKVHTKAEIAAHTLALRALYEVNRKLTVAKTHNFTDARKYAELEKQIEQYKLSYTAFANGGIVTQPTLSLIGEAGYNEAVIPLKDSNDPLQTKELTKAIKDLTTIVIQQAEDNRETRKLSEDQLATLLLIEEKVS